MTRNSPILMPIRGQEVNQMNNQTTKGACIIAGLITLTLTATIACNGIGGQSTGTTANGDLVFAGCYAPNEILPWSWKSCYLGHSPTKTLPPSLSLKKILPSS